MIRLGYYKKIDPGPVAGAVAPSQQLIDTEDHVDEMSTSMIIDNEGGAYLLSDEADALLMTPVTDIVDQSHETGDSWLSLRDLYFIQKIELTKNAIKRIKVNLRNTSGADQEVEFSIYGAEFETDYSINPVAKETIVIPAGTVDNQFEILFNVKNLNRHYYYLHIKRTNVTGVDIAYDENGGYGKLLQSSPDGADWDATNYDLKFIEEYANTNCFDVVDATAVIGGSKVQNLDTHVEIPPANNYSPRYDIVIMTKEGLFEVEEGIPASKPELPNTVETNELVVAHVYVPQEANSAEAMTVYQDDTNNQIRPRSVLERLRRVERKQNWDWIFNSPERIKVESEEFIDSGESVNIGEVNGLYQIVTKDQEVFTDDYKGNTKINVGASSLDHTDHTGGTVKLQRESTVTANWEVNPAGAVVAETRGAYFYSSTKDSRFLYNVFYAPYTMSFSQVQFATGYMTKVQGIRIWVIDFDTNTLIAKSNPTMMYELRNVGRGQATWNTFYFGSPVTIQGGRKYRFLIEAYPVAGSGNMAEIYAPCYAQSYTGAQKVHVEHRYLPYPSNVGYLAPKYYDRRDYYIPMKLLGSSSQYAVSGVIQSTVYAATGPIQIVKADINISLSAESRYTLEVSNDGGEHWYQMTGASYVFGSSSDSFCYRITFYTSNRGQTPILAFNSAEGYAVKFELTLTSGSTSELTGTLVTEAFDGAQIAKDYLSILADKFSHYEWFLTEMNEGEGTILVDIQNSDDGMSWSDWLTGLTLEDLEHVDVDYKEYDEAVEPDDWNLYCDFEADPTLGFFWNYARLKFHLSRPNAETPSPTVNKVGCVIILE